MSAHPIRCRFCDWTTLSFWTGKDGRAHSGMGRLRTHIEDQHPDEADEIFGDGETDEYDE